jgi:hypothetical protein
MNTDNSYASKTLWETTSRCDGHCGNIGTLYQYSCIERGRIVDPVFYCDQCRCDLEDDSDQSSRIARFSCGAI